MASLLENSKVFIRSIFSVVISGDSAVYFIEIIMFVSFECTLTQNRIRVRMVISISNGPTRGQ